MKHNKWYKPCLCLCECIKTEISRMKKSIIINCDVILSKIIVIISLMLKLAFV